MSIRVSSIVWEKFPRGGSEKLVLLAMADWCNDEGGSLYPSIAAVAKKVCLTPKQARLILHKLINEGYLTVVGNEFGGNKNNTRRYVLNISKLLTPNPEVTPPLDVTPNIKCHIPSHGGSLTPPAEVSQSIIDTSINTSVYKLSEDERILTPDFIDSELWQGFLKFRLKLKANNSGIAIRALIKELAKLRDAGHEPEEVINQSIRSSWKDVYPIKNNQMPVSTAIKETGRVIAAKSIFKPKNTKHLNENLKTVESQHESIN